MRPTLAYAVPLELRRFYGLRASSPSFHAPPDLRPAPPSAARTSPPPTRSTRSAGSAPRAPAVRVRVRVRVRDRVRDRVRVRVRVRVRGLGGRPRAPRGSCTLLRDRDKDRVRVRVRARASVS